MRQAPRTWHLSKDGESALLRDVHAHLSATHALVAFGALPVPLDLGVVHHGTSYSILKDRTDPTSSLPHEQ